MRTSATYLLTRLAVHSHTPAHTDELIGNESDPAPPERTGRRVEHYWQAASDYMRSRQ